MGTGRTHDFALTHGDVAALTRVRDIVVGTGDAAVEAYFVEPATARADVLWLHWLDEPRRDRTQFLRLWKLDVDRLDCGLLVGLAVQGEEALGGPPSFRDEGEECRTVHREQETGLRGSDGRRPRDLAD